MKKTVWVWVILLCAALLRYTPHHSIGKRDLVVLLSEVNEKRTVISGLDPISFEYYFGSKPFLQYLKVDDI